MNCLIYARVSTEEQAELSIPAQIQAMREYAERHNWAVVQEFLEPGVSGRSVQQRQALQAMLERCRLQPQIDFVLVHKIDRLARNVFDHVNIRFLLKQHNIRLASVVENVDDSISGQLLENIMASIAQFYSGNLGEEVKKGMRMLVERGGWPHKPTRGYRQIRSETGEVRIEFDEPTASALRWAFEEYASGWTSIWQLSKDLAKQGIIDRKGRPIPLESMRSILKNPFYAGRVRWKDAEYPGRHPALISEDLFARVQQVMRQHQGDPAERPRRHHFLLRRIAVCCDCGSKLTAEHHPRGSYYRCSRNTRARGLCRAKFSNVHVAHESLRALYCRLHVPAELKTKLLSAAESLLAGRAAQARTQLEALKMKKTKLEERELKLTEAFAAGEISLQAYRPVIEKLRQQAVAITATLVDLQRDPEVLMQKVKAVLATTASLLELHLKLDERQRPMLLRTIVRALILEQGEIIGYTLNPPFDQLLTETPSGSSSSSPSPTFDKTEVTSTINSILEHDIPQDLRSVNDYSRDYFHEFNTSKH